jgi:hypothetical protein
MQQKQDFKDDSSKCICIKKKREQNEHHAM